MVSEVRNGPMQTLGPAPLNGRADGLAAALRTETSSLHRQAERSGIIRDLLKGRVERFGYALFLRNLLPAYTEMERGLERHRRAPAIQAFALPQLYRAPSLLQDLEDIEGSAWRQSLPLLPAGRGYGRRIALIAESDPDRLIGHSYVRYLGDLSGGQILRRKLSRSLGLYGSGLTFYDFPGIEDIQAFKTRFRTALDQAAVSVDTPAAILAEAEEAFRHNIAVSEEVASALERTKGCQPEPAALV